MGVEMENFVLEKYLGTWYDIAHYPTLVWQKGCAKSMAEYTLLNSETVQVKNTCLTPNGQVIYSRKGEASLEFPKCPRKPGKFKILFNDGLPADPEGQYWVLWTDYNRYAVVSGGPDSDYLWVLSRTSKIPLSDVQPLLEIVDKLGYDSKQLVTSPDSLLF